MGHANRKKVWGAPPRKLEEKKMDGVDRIKKINLLEEKQYILVKKRKILLQQNGILFI